MNLKLNKTENTLALSGLLVLFAFKPLRETMQACEGAIKSLRSPIRSAGENFSDISPYLTLSETGEQRIIKKKTATYIRWKILWVILHIIKNWKAQGTKSVGKGLPWFYHKLDWKQEMILLRRAWNVRREFTPMRDQDEKGREVKEWCFLMELWQLSNQNLISGVWLRDCINHDAASSLGGTWCPRSVSR